MKMTLVSIAFNGYGRFVGQFLAAHAYAIDPIDVIIVLGQDHGCDVERLKQTYPRTKFIEYKGRPTFGKLRNIGIRKVKTEWVWFVSIDDVPHPNALSTFQKYKKYDYICAQWITVGLDEPPMVHFSPTPQEMNNSLKLGQKGGFIIPHSPFKKWLWEKHPYKHSNLPNYDFLLHCVYNSAKFVKADNPTTTYLRRPDSHARTELHKIQRAANREKRILQRGLRAYYG